MSGINHRQGSRCQFINLKIHNNPGSGIGSWKRTANSEIRKRLELAEKHWGWTTYIPKFEYTTDNAAMIGIVGYLKYLDDYKANSTVTATARLKVTE